MRGPVLGWAALALAGCPLIGEGALQEKIDEDGDGFAGVDWGGNDCDDGDAAIHPRADTTPQDAVDQDCDGLLECFADDDDDGFLDEAAVVDSEERCVDDPIGDCDDDDGSVFPGAEEPLGVDLSCDGAVRCYEDLDRDGFGSEVEIASPDQRCVKDDGESLRPDDCDDHAAATNPDGEDLWGDELDQDCSDGADCPEGDADGDELCDTPEEDPCPRGSNVLDDDGDGIVEGCDVDDDDLDSDDDGLLDTEEDQDLDGVVDGDETDPGAPDSDGDGRCDHPREDNDRDGIDPVDACHSLWLVDTSARGAATGLTWDDAFPTLAEAVSAVASGDEVWVARGVYTAAPKSDSVLDVPENVSFFGGFSGDETALEERTPTEAPTVLDGQAVTPHVVKLTGGSAIDGFIVRKGSALQAAPGPGEGAGVLVLPQSTGVRIAGCRFQDNAALSAADVEVAPNSEVVLGASLSTGATGGSIVVREGAHLQMTETVILGATGGPALYVSPNARADLFLVDLQDDEAGGVVVEGELTFVSGSFVQLTGGPAVDVVQGTARISTSSFFDDEIGIRVADGETAELDDSTLWGNDTDLVGSLNTDLANCLSQPTNPFVLTSAPTGARRIVLSSGSACVDTGDTLQVGAMFGIFGADWTTMNALDSGLGDANAPDPGRHYPPPQ